MAEAAVQIITHCLPGKYLLLTIKKRKKKAKEPVWMEGKMIKNTRLLCRKELMMDCAALLVFFKDIYIFEIPSTYSGASIHLHFF